MKVRHERVAHMIETLATHEASLLRIRPYGSTENRIEGAVMVLIDLDQFTRGPVS